MINIAIIDDHQILINGLINIFKNYPDINLVFTANNGVQTLKEEKLLSIDVFIIDIEMPKMDGIDLSQKILVLYPNAKILILSMYNDLLLIKKMKEFGIYGFLPKNIDEVKMVETIHNINNGTKVFEHLSNQEEKPKTIEHKILFSELSRRELEVLALIVEGYTNNQIGKQLFLSPKTVDNHRSSMMKKLNVNNVASLVRVALKTELLSTIIKG